MSQIEEISELLARSDADVASKVREFRRNNTLVVYLDEVAISPDTLRILRVRAQNQRLAASRARSPEARMRWEENALALERVVDWWDKHAEEGVRYVCLSGPPDVSFLLWFGIDGQFVAGFEARDATKLTYARGKAFFGPDWEPSPDPNRSVGPQAGA